LDVTEISLSPPTGEAIEALDTSDMLVVSLKEMPPNM
jgi:hypothetical protein